MIPAELKDIIYLNLRGFTVWIKEANFYGRMDKGKKLKVCKINCDMRSDDWAKGNYLALSCMDFSPYYKSDFTKQKKVNEVSIHIHENDVPILIDFLLKNFKPSGRG